MERKVVDQDSTPAHSSEVWVCLRPVWTAVDNWASSHMKPVQELRESAEDSGVLPKGPLKYIEDSKKKRSHCRNVESFKRSEWVGVGRVRVYRVTTSVL